jgi:hypothetical protein
MSSTDRVWELMKKIGICMLASWDGQELQARPMRAYVRPGEHAVLFLADALSFFIRRSALAPRLSNLTSIDGTAETKHFLQGPHR